MILLPVQLSLWQFLLLGFLALVGILVLINFIRHVLWYNDDLD